jgi:hypothetical protein
VHTEGMKGGEQDGELSDDVVGVASARLLAAGVAASRRRQALRLLGVLESVAGPDQVVRRPVRDVAVEFGLPPHEVETWLDDLELVGVVERWGDHVELMAVEPAAPGALRLHDFLALADEPVVAPDADVVPLRRMARPAAGVLAAAALLIVAILAGTTLPRDDEGSPVAATGVNVTSTTAETTTTEGTTESPARGTSTTSRATSSTAGVAPTSTAPTAPPACPSEPPVVELLETVPQGGGGVQLAGIIRNPSGAGATVRSVVVQGVNLPVSVLVPADGTAPWAATLTGLGLPATLSAGLGDWDWLPPLPEGCPSS